LALFVAAGPSQAMLPATPEQILCNSTYIIVADVLAAASADCRVIAGSHPTCDPKHLVRLKAQVKEILGAQPADAKYPPGRTLWAGETIDIKTSARVVQDSVEKYDGQEGLVFKASPGTLLSEERLNAAYAKQDFLMSVSMTKFDLEMHDTLWAVVWPTTRKAWALRTMSDWKHRRYDCPRPL